jgi:hypothetical protein
MRRYPMCLAVAVLITALCAAPAMAQITLDGGEVQVTMTTSASAFQGAPAVASERFEVAWQAEGQDGTGIGASGIVGRAFDGAGNPQSGELAINVPATGAHSHPRITSDSSGNFVVAWRA